MLRNYLAAALRNLVRNRLYAVINIVGLAVAFTAVIFIALFVRDEMSFDTWIPGHENVFRVAKSLYPPGGPPLRSNGSTDTEGLLFKQDFPEVTAMARLTPQQRGIRRGNIEAGETIVWADPEIFEVFPFPAHAGELRSALAQADSLVITRKIARKYFGRDNVIGETLEIDRAIPMRITAVLEDLPTRSHLDIDIIVSGRSSHSPLARESKPGFGVSGAFTYVRLAPGTLHAVRAALPALIDRHNPPITLNPKDGPIRVSTAFVYELQPISEIHMMPFHDRAANFSRPSGDLSVVVALAMTGGLILLIAVINFTNLMTARAGRRSVEVGVRKVSGAQRADLVFQFVGESMGYVLLAAIAAIALASTLLPTFNSFLGRTTTFLDPGMAAAGLILICVTGLLGGLYPAFILSAFRPASVLKGHTDSGYASGVLRQALVIAQFAILIGMIVATLVIGRQTTFAVRSAFRLETDQLLLIAGGCRDAFKETVAALPGVRDVACSGRSFFDGRETVGLTERPDGSYFNMYFYDIEPKLLELFGLKLLAGRLPTRPGDRILNETAVRELGFASPEAAIGGEVVAVVPEFPLHSMRESTGAVTFRLRREGAGYLVAKLDGARIGETLPSIDAAWQGLETGVPIGRVFYDQKVQQRYLDLARQTQAFTALSMTAVFVACLGLFGLAAFTAEARTKEIGIRKAMGARRIDILRLLLWQFTKPVLWANVIAWPVAYFVMQRWLEGFAYHIDMQAWMFLAASAAALVIAVATVAGHALMVARTRPAAALRYE